MDRGNLRSLTHCPTIPAKTPLVAIHLDTYDWDSAPAEQPPSLLDMGFAPEVGTHDEAETSKLDFLLLLHTVVVKHTSLHVQFRDKSVHPRVRGANDCRAGRLGSTEHTDRVSKRVVA